MARPKPTATTTDLSPFVLREVPYEKGTLRFRQPLFVHPYWDEMGLLCVEYPELSIDVFARTRRELLEELDDRLVVLWEGYAKEDDSILSPEALELKLRLLVAIEEVPRA